MVTRVKDGGVGPDGGFGADEMNPIKPDAAGSLGERGPARAVEVQGPAGRLRVGAGAPLVILAGPCLLESRELALRVADGVARACIAAGFQVVFKGSFDKANRTSRESPRGPGLEAGLRLLEEVRATCGMPVTTDVHLPEQAAPVAECVDLLQIPAFLCRQTDVLEACGRTGKPVNLKKGQFLAPGDLKYGVEKLLAAGAAGVLQTERGTTFGYHDLVVDMRSLPILRAHGWPVVFDATHSVQKPGGLGAQSGGARAFTLPLMRAALACGIDALFLEVHPDPPRAWSDAATQVSLDALPGILEQARILTDAMRVLEDRPERSC